MSRRLLTCIAAGGVAGLLVTSAAAADTLTLSPLASVRFPYRAFVLTTSKPVPLDSDRVVVRENGQPVDGVSVVPASRAARGTFGVVLVIDASNSMRGRPIAGAVAAARLFAAHSADASALGLVTFNNRIHRAVRPTTNERKVAAALSSLPALASGTRIYDAVSAAVADLTAAKVKARSIVLLSDGRDIGSRLSVQAAAEAARRAQVRVFVVGLRSRQYTPAPLRLLSHETGGSYVEAGSAASLAGIYRALSEQLAREYLLRYRSLAGPATDVVVQVAAGGLTGIGTWRFRSPALPSTGAPPYHRSFLKRFVQAPASVLAISLFVALLAWFAVRRILRQRETNLRLRIGEFAGDRRTQAVKRHVTTSRQWFMEALAPSAERLLSRYTWWERFERELEIGRFPIAPVPLAALTASTTVVVAILLGLVSPVLAVLSLAIPLGVRTAYKTKLRKQRDAFAEQLPTNLSVLAASLRAGHSFISSLSSVVDEAEEPSRSELRRAVADDQLGVPVEDALMRVAERMASGDLEQVALVAALQRETGGNTAEVLDAVVDACRERSELRGLVKALTAQGRMSRWILTALPVAVGFITFLISPEYLKPLFTDSGGQIMLAVAAGLLVAGSYLIKRITEIEL